MIEVHNVTKYYGQVRALHDVSFSVKKGEIVGLLGPNGSGKTTLMRILTGFFPPTEGKVVVAGLDVETSSLEVRRRLGYLPENVVLYPDMTVRAFLGFCVRVKARASAERGRQVERVLHDCALEHMAHRLIGTLSKGYRQRVGLAQALLCDPEILILDEPTIGLDPHQVIEMRELIKGLGGKTTVLLSSHILHEVGLTSSLFSGTFPGEVGSLRKQAAECDKNLGTVKFERDNVKHEEAGLRVEIKKLQNQLAANQK